MKLALSARELRKDYGKGAALVRAVDDVSLDVEAGESVAIARALANEPLVVLADEPTGNLDSAATTDLLRLFDELHTNGQTLVTVTHDTRIAATADRLISMRDGKFVDETRLTGGSARSLSAMAGFEG